MGQEEVYQILKNEYEKGNTMYLTGKEIHRKLKVQNVDLCLSAVCVNLNRLWRSGRVERRQNKWGMWVPGFRYVVR